MRARLHVCVTHDGGRVRTPPAGVPFDFEWRRPSAAGFVATRARLRDLLANPVDRVPHCYILGTLLGVSEATRGLTAADLLAALGGRHGSFDGRRDVVGRLVADHAGDPAVVRYYRARLDAGDPAVLGDLAWAPIWEAGFAEPVFAAFARDADEYGDAAKILDRRWDRKLAPRLADLVVADPEKHAGALALLSRHRGDWLGNRKVVAALSDAVRKAYPLVGRDSRDVPVDELEPWAAGVRLWALTGDPRVVRRLAPALDDRRRFRDPRPAHPAAVSGAATPHEPERACDAAMAAIWVALDGPAAAERRLGVTVPPDREEVPNDEVLAWRDLQRLALSIRLAARRIPPP